MFPWKILSRKLQVHRPNWVWKEPCWALIQNTLDKCLVGMRYDPIVLYGFNRLLRGLIFFRGWLKHLASASRVESSSMLPKIASSPRHHGQWAMVVPPTSTGPTGPSQWHPGGRSRWVSKSLGSGQREPWVKAFLREPNRNGAVPLCRWMVSSMENPIVRNGWLLGVPPFFLETTIRWGHSCGWKTPMNCG